MGWLWKWSCNGACGWAPVAKFRRVEGTAVQWGMTGGGGEAIGKKEHVDVEVRMWIRGRGKHVGVRWHGCDVRMGWVEVVRRRTGSAWQWKDELPIIALYNCKSVRKVNE